MLIKRKVGQLLILTAVLGFCTRCNFYQAEGSTTAAAKVDLNSEIPVYNFDELEPLLYSPSDKTFIINFWAMWCSPCVKELPYLQAYADQNPEVELILVSLDFAEEIETKLKPFLKKKNISAKVILLDDPDSNSWIDKIDPHWSGALPFTIIFNNEKRLYYERSFENVEDLETEVSKIDN